MIAETKAALWLTKLNDGSNLPPEADDPRDRWQRPSRPDYVLAALLVLGAIVVGQAYGWLAGRIAERYLHE